MNKLLVVSSICLPGLGAVLDPGRGILFYFNILTALPYIPPLKTITQKRKNKKEKGGMLGRFGRSTSRGYFVFSGSRPQDFDRWHPGQKQR